MIDKETKKWLIKAINDYKTAEKLINLPENEIITDTFYAIDIRYPDEFYIPTIEEAKNAFESATFVKEFIFKKLNITERDIL